MISALEELGIGYHEARGKMDCWLPKEAADPNVGPESLDSECIASTTPLDVSQTEAMPDTTDTDKPALRLWFEISIVRTPWLPGLYGIRFRRVSGDPWIYRESCHKLLEKAKL
jgi:hypothetical protein